MRMSRPSHGVHKQCLQCPCLHLCGWSGTAACNAEGPKPIAMVQVSHRMQIARSPTAPHCVSRCSRCRATLAANLGSNAGACTHQQIAHKPASPPLRLHRLESTRALTCAAAPA